MSNFLFLKNEFKILQNESIKSEVNIIDDPEVSAIYSRKALENSVKFVYRIDEDLDVSLIKELDIFGLINNKDFQNLLPKEYISELNLIRKIGNQAAHSSKVITSKDSLYANQCLYKFQRWIVEVYGSVEVDSSYNTLVLAKDTKISSDTLNKQEVILQTTKQNVLGEENKQLQDELTKLKKSFSSQSANKKKTKRTKIIQVEDINEADTRKLLIDVELKEAGYKVDNFKKGKDIEYKLKLEDGKIGYADYVLWDDEDKPLAVIEAKRFSKDVSIGKHQASLYAQALKKEFNQDNILIFLTNGRVIQYTNGVYPLKEIHSIFPKYELIRALNKIQFIKNIKPTDKIVNSNITDREYQYRVIKSVLKNFEALKKRALLVMATGTGKTRVGISIVDILIRAKWINKILFLADRIELVKQAKTNFDLYLKETSVNLGLEKDLDNRMHFGTYETVHNLIKNEKYNSAYFDLIIIDEAHRTIYKKYKAIFEYFNSLILGLTATPTGEVHRNTYDFFDTSFEEPTDNYPLDRAIADNWLVNFRSYEIDLGIVQKGLVYADLSVDEKEEWEDKFDNEDDISSQEINKRIFNQDTNDKVLKHLKEYGLKIEEGNRIGKTIIFAKNIKHAQFIKERFDILYPKSYDEAQVIHSEISHVDSLIDNFKNASKNPQIAISVDMLDTGIDVPEIVNLVFFKQVKSKIKFWQMIGRGTRLCPNLFGDNEDKAYFNIFDFCNNFTYFGSNPNGKESRKTVSLKESLFLKRVNILRTVKNGTFKDTLLNTVRGQISNINIDEYFVKKNRAEIEELQSNKLEYITDELYKKIQTIAQYIEDNSEYQIQSFQMEVLNAEESILNKKSNRAYVDDINKRCFVLKSKVSSINAIKEKENIINDVINNKFDLKNSIDDLETVRLGIENLADISKEKNNTTVKTNFSDKILKIENLRSDSYIDKASIKTEIQKVLEEYIKKLHFIKKLEKTELITSTDIDNIEYHFHNMDKIIDDKLNDNEDFRNFIKSIINSSNKKVANNILDNFIAKSTYTQKQIEVMIEIKKTIQGKQFMNVHKSITNVRGFLTSDLHPISGYFGNLNENEQDGVLSAIELIEDLDKETIELI